MRNLLNRIKQLESQKPNDIGVIIFARDDLYLIEGKELSQNEFDIKYPRFEDNPKNRIIRLVRDI